MVWEAIKAITMMQCGLITRAQALEVGATDEWLRWAVREGRLKRIRPGVYAIAGLTSEYQPIMAACLAAGRSAAISHLAAASLWGAEQVMKGRVEITTFDDRAHHLPGVMMHRSRLDASRAITTRLNLPVVVPPLAVVQVAETCSPHLAKSVANDLVKRHCTNFPAILHWIDLVGDGRHHGLRDLCLQAIEVGGHDDSPPARALCHKLTRAGLGPFETDFQVVTPGGVLLIDIAWPRSRFGLEYIGGRDHDSVLARADDARRRLRLAALGWRVLDVNRAMTYDEIIGWVRAGLAAGQSGLSGPVTRREGVG